MAEYKHIGKVIPELKFIILTAHKNLTETGNHKLRATEPGNFSNTERIHMLFFCPNFKSTNHQTFTNLLIFLTVKNSKIRRDHKLLLHIFLKYVLSR